MPVSQLVPGIRVIDIDRPRLRTKFDREMGHHTPRFGTKRSYNLHWYGPLALNNIAEVSDLLRRLLKSTKTHTTITYNPEQPWSRCHVETAQALVYEGRDCKFDAVNYTADWNKGWGHITVHNSYGLYMIDTRVKYWWQDPSRMAEAKRPAGWKQYDVPYFSFEGNKVTIEHRAPCGDWLRWIFATEYHYDRD